MTSRPARFAEALPAIGRAVRLLASVAVMAVAGTLAASAPGQHGRPLATLDTSAGLPHYEASCAACHGYLGEGLLGATPPLAGTVPELLSLEGGREYVVGVVLHGLSGRIEVDGREYEAIMPSFGQLPDQYVADLLNHMATAWGNRELLPVGEPEFTGLEVALARTLATDQVELARTRRTLTRALEQ